MSKMANNKMKVWVVQASTRCGRYSFPPMMYSTTNKRDAIEQYRTLHKIRGKHVHLTCELCKRQEEMQEYFNHPDD